MTQYYPAFLKTEGKRCVVVGGGQVALRKVKALLEHGASVAVISPELCPRLDELAGSGAISVRRRQFRRGDLAGAFIAIAATDSERTNLRVAREARENGVLVNVVDDAASSDFIVPSSFCRGALTVSVCTSGRSPALSRKIRERLEGEFGEEYVALLRLVDGVRSAAKQQGIKVDADTWQNALDLDLLIALLQKGDTKKARAVLLEGLGVPLG